MPEERTTPILVMPPAATRFGPRPTYHWTEGSSEATLIFILDDEIIEQFRKAYPAKKANA